MLHQCCVDARGCWPVSEPVSTGRCCRVCRGQPRGAVELGRGWFPAGDGDGSAGEGAVFGGATKALDGVGVPVAGVFVQTEPASGEDQDAAVELDPRAGAARGRAVPVLRACSAGGDVEYVGLADPRDRGSDDLRGLRRLPDAVPRRPRACAHVRDVADRTEPALAAIGICPLAAISDCPETASLVTERD